MENTSSEKFESFAEAFEKSLVNKVDNVRPGRIVPGTVVDINREVVTVDVGFKSEGVVPTGQFMDADGKSVSKITPPK